MLFDKVPMECKEDRNELLTGIQLFSVEITLH